MSVTFDTSSGRPRIRIERKLRFPVETVWRAVTEPAQLGQWYPFQVTEIDFRVGGTILFDDGEGTTMSATIVELEPPRVFAFSEHAPESMPRESDDLVHMEVVPDGDGCRLIFTHSFDDHPAAASYTTGWNACLDALEMVLEETPVEFNVDWATEHEHWADQFGLGEGSIESAADGSVTLCVERQLVRPVDDVWALLSGTHATAESIAVGAQVPPGFVADGISAGSVTHADPPSTLEYEWLVDARRAGTVRWEMTPGTGHGARLVLTMSIAHQFEHLRDDALRVWSSRVAEIARSLLSHDLRNTS